jgi:hypothetical protein
MFNIGKSSNIGRHQQKNIQINAPAIRSIFQDKILQQKLVIIEFGYNRSKR